MKVSRDIVRQCRTASFALHAQDFEKADKNIKAARKALDELQALFKGHSDIYYAGFVEHAQQEYSEVTILRNLLTGKGQDKDIPSPDEIGVEYAAYLNGLGDVTGELRRHILDLIRKESLEEAEKFLEMMESIHATLMDFDYPDAITRGLRRKTDVSRSLIEKTRGDVINAIGQKKLEVAMRDLQSKL